MFFVSPGDRICAADGNDVTIPYKGLVISNQAYLDLIAGEEE